jgi:hypothetical protein
MLNVRVIAQGEPPSTCETLVLCNVQLSVAITSTFTLASVGNTAGLQPKLLLVGALVITGAFVSTVQV